MITREEKLIYKIKKLEKIISALEQENALLDYELRSTKKVSKKEGNV